MKTFNRRWTQMNADGEPWPSFIRVHLRPSAVGLLLLCLAWTAIGQSTLQRNSLTTNILGTNLVWTPYQFNIRGITPSLELWNTAGGVDQKRFKLQTTSLSGTGKLKFFLISDDGLNASLLGEFNEGGSISLSGDTNRLSMAGGVLLLDGVQISASASAPINNWYSTNNFYVTGKGNTLIITQTLTLNYVKTNLLATDASGVVTNALYGSGISWDPATRTISSTASGGLATSGSAYSIVGGSAIATNNWVALSNAYVSAKSATPQGAALAAGNRYTIFLLPGVYDMGASALTLDTQFIDIVGLSDNTGQQFNVFGWSDLGDTVLKSSLDCVDLTTGSDDITLANVCIQSTSANPAFTALKTGNQQNFKLINVLFRSASDRSMTASGVTYGGQYLNVRSWYDFSLGYSTASGFFYNCKVGGSSLGGDVASGTFIDCESGSTSFGNGTASGTFIRCRGGAIMAGVVGGFTGTAIDCYSTANLNYGSGVIRNSTFSGVIYNKGQGFEATDTGRFKTNLFVGGTLQSTNGFSSVDTTAAVSIATTGWTNTFGKNAIVYYDGTAVTATVFNGAGTALYTNSTALSGGTVLLQPSGKVILSGTGVAGRASVF